MWQWSRDRPKNGVLTWPFPCHALVPGTVENILYFPPGVQNFTYGRERRELSVLLGGALLPSIPWSSLYLALALLYDNQFTKASSPV